MAMKRNLFPTRLFAGLALAVSASVVLNCAGTGCDCARSYCGAQCDDYRDSPASRRIEPSRKIRDLPYLEKIRVEDTSGKVHEVAFVKMTRDSLLAHPISFSNGSVRSVQVVARQTAKDSARSPYNRRGMTDGEYMAEVPAAIGISLLVVGSVVVFIGWLVVSTLNGLVSPD